MDGAPALFVGQARLRTTSQSRCRSTAPLVGEPLACRPGPRWTSKVSLYQKQQCPATEGSSFRTMFLVKLLLISVAGHSFLRYIELSASSRKWPGLPKPLLQGEVARRRRDGEVVQSRACPL